VPPSRGGEAFFRWDVKNDRLESAVGCSKYILSSLLTEEEKKPLLKESVRRHAISSQNSWIQEK